VLGLGGSTWSGVVVDAETGAPVEGIHVSLQGGGGFGGYTIVEATFTDRDGEFRLHTSRNDTILFVNAPGLGNDEDFRPDYIGSGPLLYTDRPMRIELSRSVE
jgi:hypothetical protein